MARVAVVGGGVVGACCAYYLAKAGHAVTVLDRGAFGSGCSHANCGYVCPSHVLPFATPGAIWVTSRLDGTVSRVDPATGKVTLTIPIGLGVTVICFALIYLAPGNPVQSLLPPDSGWNLNKNTSSSAQAITDQGTIIGTGGTAMSAMSRASWWTRRPGRSATSSSTPATGGSGTRC